MAREKDDDVSNIMLIFVRGSAILVGLAVLALIALFIVSRLSPGPGPSDPGPYNVASRPVPNVGALEDLLPTQLGPFKRTSLAGALSDFSAVYTRGTDKITIVGSQAVSVRAAQEGVSRVVRTSGRGANQLEGADPSYYLTLRDGGPSQYAWSHGRWFFDIQATSQSALDEFMRAFKY
jgi:hypothetical protein